MTTRNPTITPTQTITHTSVTVQTTATLVCTLNAGRITSRVYNNSSATIYLGTSAVTTASGFPLAASSAHVHICVDALYACVATSTADVRVLEEI